MADESVDVGGDGGSGSIDSGDLGGGDPSGNFDLASIESEANADALAEFGLTPEGKAGDGSAAAKAVEESRLEAWAKKQGYSDPDEFIAAQYSQRAEAKRLAETVKILEQRINNPEPTRDVAAEFQSALQSSPDVQAIDQTIAAVDNRIKQIDREQVSLAQEAGQINNKIGQIQAQVQTADPENLPRLYAELNRLQNRMDTVNSEWKANTLGKDNSIDLMRVYQGERNRVAREIRESIAREEQSRGMEAQNAERIRANYDSSFEAVATSAGIDPESDFGKSFNKVVKSQVADYLDTLPNGLDPAGLYRATQQIANTLMKQLNINPRTGAARNQAPVTPRQTIVPRRPVGDARGQLYQPLSPTTSTGDPLDDPSLSPKQKAELARKVSRGITDRLIKQSRQSAGVGRF